MNEVRTTGPKDVFLHLLAVIGLYVSVVSFGALVFELINIYLPDVLSGPAGHYAYQAVRWPLSVLVIVFPLYGWLSWYLRKDLRRFPEKGDLKTRRWLIAFTLFLATVVIAGDLIALIFNFLNGELTVRFFLKVATVFMTAAAVFIYYLWDFRRNPAAPAAPAMKLFSGIVGGVAAVAVVTGFLVAGSPQAERLRRFDEIRMNHLQIVQSEIINYWQRKEKLPPSLDVLQDDIRGFTPPRDPESGAPYEYRPAGDLSFEICAIFKTSDTDSGAAAAPQPVPYYDGGSWRHAAGRTCFSRTIDPELYPSFIPPKPRR